MFLQLHELVDKIHSDVEEFADTIAERITALGGAADGRVQSTARSTAILEYPLDATSGDFHLKALSAAIVQFGKAVRLDIDKATDAALSPLRINGRQRISNRFSQQCMGDKREPTDNHGAFKRTQAR